MSGYATTPNYGLKKPVENADDDAWGGHLNSDMDTLDSVIKTVENKGLLAFNNVGRNLSHNPLFNIAQRGAGPWTGIGYTVDRWLVSATLDTISITNNAAADSDRAGIGDEYATRLLVNNFTGNAGATAVNYVAQGIENVYRLARKTVTVSFWARCGAGALKLGVGMFQYFGTGGSPSASVGPGGQPITLSTSWARYSAIFTLPSVAGKISGSNGDHATWLQFFFSSGANNAGAAGGIGVQSGAIVLWGVQLEIGNVMTPLEKPDPRYDLSNCQRFYQTGVVGLGGYAAGSAGHNVSVPFAVPMHHTPTITPTFITQTNCGSSSVNAQGGTYYFPYTTTTAAGAYALSGTFTASADL